MELHNDGSEPTQDLFALLPENIPLAILAVNLQNHVIGAVRGVLLHCVVERNVRTSGLVAVAVGVEVAADARIHESEVAFGILFGALGPLWVRAVELENRHHR